MLSVVNIELTLTPFSFFILPPPLCSPTVIEKQRDRPAKNCDRRRAGVLCMLIEMRRRFDRKDTTLHQRDAATCFCNGLMCKMRKW